MKYTNPSAGKKVFKRLIKAFSLFAVALLLFTSVLILNQRAEAQQLVCPERAIEQITDSTEASRDPSINADGTRIALASHANISGGNPENNREIYVFDTKTLLFTQITDTTSGFNEEPSINADGTRIAFRTTANVGGGNPEGNNEIYLFDTTTGIMTQITDTTSDNSRNPSINADGTRIAFQSTANLTGGNPDGNNEIYLFDTTTSMFTQITDSMGFSNNNASINADGTRIAFQSTANYTGGNPDGNLEIFLANTTTGIITQITNTTAPAFNVDASISGDGTRIAFQSRENIGGGNPDGNLEVYLATCLDPATARNIPTLSEWGLIAMAGILGIVGFMVIRRRKVTA